MSVVQSILYNKINRLSWGQLYWMFMFGPGAWLLLHPDCSVFCIDDASIYTSAHSSLPFDFWMTRYWQGIESKLRLSVKGYDFLSVWYPRLNLCPKLFNLWLCTGELCWNYKRLWRTEFICIIRWSFIFGEKEQKFLSQCWWVRCQLDKFQ